MVKKNNYKENERIISDFSFGNWRDNLFLVFGTDSILKSLFVISLRKLPYNGMIWTRIIRKHTHWLTQSKKLKKAMEMYR